LNTRRIGAIGTAHAITYFVSIGASVFVPIADSEKYDLVIDWQGLRKVQVKYTGERERKAYRVDLRTFGGYRNKTYQTKYADGDFDLLFVQCADGSQYLLPYEQIRGHATIALGKRQDDYRVGGRPENRTQPAAFATPRLQRGPRP
jgi:hypothetical protein